jgi:hypothetical protein
LRDACLARQPEGTTKVALAIALAGIISGVATIILMGGTPGLLLGLSLVASGIALAYIMSR